MLLKQLPICQIKLPFVSRYVDNPCREILHPTSGASGDSGGGDGGIGPSVSDTTRPSPVEQLTPVTSQFHTHIGTFIASQVKI